MNTKEFAFCFDAFPSSSHLPEEEKKLLLEAQSATDKAYAPYSNFSVGAAALLKDGTVVSGANQENASFPAGICAERVVLATVSAVQKNAAIIKMAISYKHADGHSKFPISPCGVCRQALLEFSQHTRQPIRLILGGMEGEVWVIHDISQLLPLSFTSNDLKGK